MKIRIILFIALMFLGSLNEVGNCQSLPPPPPSNGHGNGGNQPPAGAPVGNGTFILMALVAAYAGRKVYVMRTDTEAR